MKKKLLPIIIGISVIAITTTGCNYDSMNSMSMQTSQTTPSKEENIKSEVVSLPIYTINENNYQLIEIEDYVQVYTDTTIEEKLKSISDHLSKNYFENLPIEVVKIEKDIAYINLKEDKNNQHSWSTYYFQGSYGGRQTSTKLVETFLQRNYKGEWIKGVKFMYNNQADWSFEHLGDKFSEIHYR